MVSKGILSWQVLCFSNGTEELEYTFLCLLAIEMYSGTYGVLKSDLKDLFTLLTFSCLLPIEE